MPKLKIKPIRCWQDQGFTLTELLITVVIAGIFATLALPALSSYIAGQRIKNASFDMMAGLTLARSEAIKRNTNTVIAPASGGWQNGWAVAAGTAGISTQNPFPGLTIDCWVGGASTACPSNINYANNGRLDTSSPSPFPSFRILSATNTNSASIRCIMIDLSGRPSSKMGSC